MVYKFSPGEEDGPKATIYDQEPLSALFSFLHASSILPYLLLYRQSRERTLAQPPGLCLKRWKRSDSPTARVIWPPSNLLQINLSTAQPTRIHSLPCCMQLPPIAATTEQYPVSRSTMYSPNRFRSVSCDLVLVRSASLIPIPEVANHASPE